MNLSQKSTGIWVVDFVDPQSGKRRRVSTETRDKGEARLRARDIMLGIDVKPAANAGRAEPAAAGFTVDDAFDRCLKTVWSVRNCKSVATANSNVKVLASLEIEVAGRMARLGSVPVSQITYSRLEKVQEELLRRGYAPGTVKRKMDALGKALTMCTRWEDERGIPILAGRPATPPIRVANSRNRVLTTDEERAIFRALDARQVKEPSRDWRRFAALIRTLLDTGLRLGEACGLRAAQFVRDADGDWQIELQQYETKSDKGRVVPCSEAVAALIPYLQTNAAPDGRVFPFKEANAWYRWDNLREDVKAASEGKLDLSDAVLHTLRHTCLTRMARSGVPIQIVSKLAGHHDIKITAAYYVHVDSADLKDAVKRAQVGPRLAVDNAARVA